MSKSSGDGGGPVLNQTHEGEHHGDYGEETPVFITQSTYNYVLCAALNSCNLGYDIGVSTAAGKLIQEDLNFTDRQRELFVGSINFWAIFGALLAQHFTDLHGRRKTFVIAAIGFMVGLIIMSISNSWGLLMFGRIFVGLGVGVGLAIDPLYIAEIVPAKHRGRLVTYSEIALNIGICLGFSTGLIFSGMSPGAEWRAMFLFGGIMPLIMIYLAKFVMPESPRWLVSKGMEDEARIILQKVYPEGFNVQPVIDDIKESLVRDEKAEHALGWNVIWNPTPAFKRMLMVGVGMAIAQQAVGIDAIQYYLLDIIEDAGLESETKESVVLILLGLIKLAFVVVGGRLFDQRGRRPLIFVSLLGCAGALLVISICFFISPSMKSSFVVLALAVYLAFFSIGMGPGAWLIPSEIFSLSIRGKAMSVATMANRITATLMSSTFLSTANGLGKGGFFALLCLVCVVVFLFMHTYLPETKGRSLEDMSVYFAEITGDNSVLEAERALRQQENTGSANIEMAGQDSQEGREVI